MSLRRFYYDESLAALTAEEAVPMMTHAQHKIYFLRNEILEIVELQATRLLITSLRNVGANKESCEK